MICGVRLRHPSPTTTPTSLVITIWIPFSRHCRWDSCGWFAQTRKTSISPAVISPLSRTRRRRRRGNGITTASLRTNRTALRSNSPPSSTSGCRSVRATQSQRVPRTVGNSGGKFRPFTGAIDSNQKKTEYLSLLSICQQFSFAFLPLLGFAVGLL